MLAAILAVAVLAPADLRTEFRSNPLGVDDAAPRLSWTLRSARRGDRQTAYQVRVEGLWDSGRVASEENAGIAYAGPPLKSHQRCTWRVRVWDMDGKASSWSAPAEWTMGILEPAGWKGVWIQHPTPPKESGPLPLFRKEFTLDRKPRRALLSVAGVGFHEVYFNGTRVGENVLAPAWTDYRDTVLYETHDVTALLTAGRNAAGVMLGNGFFNVPGGRYIKYKGSFGPPKLRLNLHLEFAGGATQDVASDLTWRTTAGPVVFSCIYGGEDYDARREAPGWDRPGFDDSGWPAAVASEAPGGVLRAQSSPPMRVMETFRSVRMTEPRPGVRVYDLGQNFAGWPVLEVSGPAGATVKVITGELLDKDGLVDQRSCGKGIWFSYTLKGGKNETFRPRFSYTGFRYLQMDPGPVTIHQASGEFVHSSAARTGTLACSNELFGRIRKLIDAAVRSNLAHVLTDCPHREKWGWLEVAHLLGPSLLYNWDLRTFIPKIAGDMRDAQTPEGLVPDFAPEFSVTRGGFRDSPEWGSAATLLPWLDYQWYGDRRVLERNLPVMARYSKYLAGKAESGILTHGLGDWYDIGPGAPGASKLTPKGVTATAVYYQDLTALARIAEILGKPEESRGYAQQAEAVRAAYLARFRKAASQTWAAMPLVVGLAPAEDRAGLVDFLVDDVRRHGNHPTAGDVGHRYLLRALLDGGRSDVIYDMTAQTEPPSYGAQLAAGATALTEAWDADRASSQNHCMLGHIEEWFWAGLAGIQPAGPGFRKVLIRPQPVGDIRWVEARHDTVRGPVVSNWKLENGVFTLHVAIPPGATGEVWVPARDGKAVKAEGARYLRSEGGAAVFAIGSGEYTFAYAGPVR